jgi:hypothetical protein
VLAAALCAGAAWAQETAVATIQAAPQPAGSAAATFWPDLSWATICWFGAVAMLLLTFRLKPLASIRNLDGLILAGMCLLLALRGAAGLETAGQWWAYLGLTGAVVYWLVRGIMSLAARSPTEQVEPLAGGVRVVLVLVGLALGLHQIATAPISPSSRDGVVGGLFIAASGKLPYGDAPGFDARSPLLYLLHAAAVQVARPTLGMVGPGHDWPGSDQSRRSNAAVAPAAMTWGNRAWWLAEPWLESADLRAARLVNLVLFVGLLAALYLIGRMVGPGHDWPGSDQSRRSNAAVASARRGRGPLLVALLAVFPGTLECLPQPDIMLPTMLLAWTLALALLPGVSGVTSTLCLMLAGLAWPWAWLGLPVLLAYFWRQGWQALGSSIGLVGGAAVALLGLAQLVRPAMPRADGALAMAGLQPLYQARLADEDTLVIDRREVNTEEIQSPAVSLYLWRPLVRCESAALKQAETPSDSLKINWPNAVNGRSVLYRQVSPTDQALPLLQAGYRKVIAGLAGPTRLAVAARTILEATWRPARYSEPPVIGSWRLWGGPPPMPGHWVLIRRGVKLAVAVLVVWAALAIFFGRRGHPQHLIGGLLIVTSGTLLASELGAATYLVWLLPLVIALPGPGTRDPGPEPYRVDLYPANTAARGRGPLPGLPGPGTRDPN